MRLTLHLISTIRLIVDMPVQIGKTDAPTLHTRLQNATYGKMIHSQHCIKALWLVTSWQCLEMKIALEVRTFLWCIFKSTDPEGPLIFEAHLLAGL